MGNCKSRCGRDGEVIEPVPRSGEHQTYQKATKFGEPTIEDRPIKFMIMIKLVYTTMKMKLTIELLDSKHSKLKGLVYVFKILQSKVGRSCPFRKSV